MVIGNTINIRELKSEDAIEKNGRFKPELWKIVEGMLTI
jgi:hypothetical protein